MDGNGGIKLEDITMDFLALGLAPNSEFVAKISEDVGMGKQGVMQF